MSVLASPLEPLAFDVVSFGFFAFVNNLWTWLALVTAAVSFWRIRAAAESSNAKISTAKTAPEEEEEEEPPASSSSAAAPAASASAPVASRSSEEDEGVVTKGLKFTVYYENYEEGDGGELTVTEELEGGGGEADEVEGGEWWERMLKLRNGERGWYRYQDLTKINGNVVRLWEWDAPCLYKN